ncbi:uncharacterized protein LOC119390894 isoform X2 [Rhipicephalus sanguineus]|uniref:uncharacterized protein LOC119390894 isoform X2 n=1 Tax=Rhipicephalus sanguineus TaxID=34632 RepID=UPI0018937C8A|nr:uncharacterized protein LOC119390894 isoform X2 [Rhipicephalus sanguineus]
MVVCTYCSVKFASSGSLNRHVLNVHKIQASSPKRECDECSEKFFTVKRLILHHTRKHNFQPVYHRYQFPTVTAFKLWKDKVEKDTGIRYIVTTSARKGNPEGKRTAYFACHRSGKHTPRAILLEVMSSDPVLDDVGLNVEVTSQCQGTTDDRKRLYVNDHVSVQLWVERMHTRRDNPVLFFKHRGQPDRPDILDRLPENLLKEQDFMLAIMTAPQLELLRTLGTNRVCVDSTRGTTAFNYQLVTVLCVDEFGAGFPVAYCISNRTDEKAMATFFASVRSKTGQIPADIFITHDGLSFYNAWSEVMGRPKHRLLCTWHVRKNWRDTVNKHIQNKKLKASVYREFQKVMDTPDSAAFQLFLDNFLVWCDLKAETQPAMLNVKYCVENNYAYHRHAWAAYFRRTAGADASMRHDAVHKVLMFCYLHKTTNKRIDRLISVLLKLTRSKIFALVPRLIRRTEDRFERDTRIRHERGQGISGRDIHKVALNQWCVRSQASYGLEYIVTEWAPCKKFCVHACAECRVCIHTATCTCPDHESRGTLCKHIHAVFKPADSDASHLSDHSDVDDIMSMVPAYEDWDDEERIEDIEELDEEECTDDRDCVTMLQAILDRLETPEVQDQARPWLRPALAKILAKLERISSPSSDTSGRSSPPSSNASTNASSNESDEQHFYSTERKTLDTCQQTGQPCLPEQDAMSDSQSDPDEQVHHRGFDHSYCKYGACSSMTMQ